jgi:hypothetical protein
LSGKGIDYPPSQANVTFKKAPRAKAETKQMPLLAAEQQSAYEPKSN